MRSRSANSFASTLSALLPCLTIFLGSQTMTLATCGWIKSYSQLAWVPSSNATCNVPRWLLRKSRIVDPLVSMMDYARTFPALSSTAITVIAVGTSLPIYLMSFIGRSFGGLVLMLELTTTLPLFGRPFFMIGVTLPMSGETESGSAGTQPDGG